MSLDLKKIAYFFILSALLILSFLSSSDSKLKNAIPEPVDITFLSIAIAITELETNENGNRGYRHVLESFQKQKT